VAENIKNGDLCMWKHSERRSIRYTAEDGKGDKTTQNIDIVQRTGTRNKGH